MNLKHGKKEKTSVHFKELKILIETILLFVYVTSDDKTVPGYIRKGKEAMMRDKKGNGPIIKYDCRNQALQNKEMSERGDLFHSLIWCKECGSFFQSRFQNNKEAHICWICTNRRDGGSETCSNSTEIEEEELIRTLENYLAEILKKGINIPARKKEEAGEGVGKVQAGTMDGVDKNWKYQLLQKLENGNLICEMSNEQLKQIFEKIEVDKDGNVDITFRSFGVS